jgi:cytochrome c oxidase subunit IV
MAQAHESHTGRIWKVFIYLSILTIVEVIFGIFKPKSLFFTNFIGMNLLNWLFIILTLVKAGYIVLKFMHLGDEKKSLKYIVLVPYFLFMLYLIFIALMEALAVGDAWATYGG